MRKIIIAITGKSATGKSTVAEYLSTRHNIPLISSYTDRPRRSADEGGHTFLSPGEFNALEVSDLLGYTKFGGCRYACLHKDVSNVCTYVISEDGLEYLSTAWAHMYRIIKVRITRDYDKCLAAAGPERLARDVGRFNLSDGFFDFKIEGGAFPLGKILKDVDELLTKIKVV